MYHLIFTTRNNWKDPFKDIPDWVPHVFLGYHLKKRVAQLQPNHLMFRFHICTNITQKMAWTLDFKQFLQNVIKYMSINNCILKQPLWPTFALVTITLELCFWAICTSINKRYLGQTATGLQRHVIFSPSSKTSPNHHLNEWLQYIYT